jgi:hypothetical protein
MGTSDRLDLSDEEIDAICAGLVQNAAKVRYLRQVLRLPVDRRPNGRPLVKRADWHMRPLDAHNASVAPHWSRLP